MAKSRPILENWAVIHTHGILRLSGKIYRDDRFKDGSEIQTSPLRLLEVPMNGDDAYAVTKNTIYTLGYPRTVQRFS